ncbi:hypothetical protein [Endozoicomonas sp. YOMI1]|uniref:hypothetical protein n=1 Tax=Endozoicomonas sp. YOMI1 TaxID=2828739 RepID=UPI0035A03782
MANDGYSLDDKRNPIAKNDLPHLIASWKQYRKSKGRPVDDFTGHKLCHSHEGGNPSLIENNDWQDRTQKAFVVPRADLKANKYDLSINRYKEVVYQEEQYEPPEDILARLKALEADIQKELVELEGML